ncbi:MAG: DUF3662 domain-containing protein [Eggerthellaceae bacterium]|nr:DUF3662 domain-containing protein [Eggerthellaceae bacterium]
MSNAPISPVQIAKKAEKQMRRETMVGAGKQFAPTLYTVLVNPDDDARLFGYYPTLAGETETYLSAKADAEGLVMDGQPLVRFVVDDMLKHGKFDIIAETVAAPIVEQLRAEEMARYGIGGYPNDMNHSGEAYSDANYSDEYDENVEQPQPGRKPPLPYVPEEEIDRSIDYGEYTFNSEDFEDYRAKAEAQSNSAPLSQANSQPLERSSVPIPTPEPENARPRQASTVAFAPGANGDAVPNRQQVRARVIDLAYRRAYDLAGTHIAIGRGEGNDIVVQDINASRKHCELRLMPEGWVVTDLGSKNGTVVNGRRVASQALQAGDVLTIGKTKFEFTILA